MKPLTSDNHMEKQLFVLGNIRSGKTLLGRALNMHPSILVQVEPFFFWFKFCDYLFHRDMLKQPVEFGWPMRAYNSDKVKLLCQSLADIEFSPQELLKLTVKTIMQNESEGSERAPGIIPRLNEMEYAGTSALPVLSSLFQLLKKSYHKEGAQYLGITEAWCDHYILPLLENSDSSRCIQVIRDPRAIIASRNSCHNLMEKYGGKYPILMLIEHWRSAVHNHLICQGDSNYLAVKYEDIVTTPEHSFERIVSFLDLPFSESMLQTHKYIDGLNKPWRQNTSFAQKKGFSTASIDKWQQVLTDEEIGLIEFLCQKEMEYLGYKISQPQYNLNDASNFYEDKEKFVPWLRPFNLEVTSENIKSESFLTKSGAL